MFAAAAGPVLSRLVGSLQSIFRLFAASLVFAAVTAWMFGGAAYWLMRVAGYGSTEMDHAIRGGVLTGLTLVGLFAAAFFARLTWRALTPKDRPA